MKHCGRCKTDKPFTEFHRRGKGYQPWCTQCRKAYHFKDYATNPIRRKRLKELTIKYRSKIESKIIKHLNANPCSCGESNILTLQFDHLKDKEFEISVGIMRGFAWGKLKQEIDKCQVLCSNCHSKKSAIQANSWKLKWLAR